MHNLLVALQYFTNAVGKHGLEKRYEAVVEELSRQGKRSGAGKELPTSLDALLTSLRAANPDGLAAPQVRILADIGALEVIGELAADHLEKAVGVSSAGNNAVRENVAKLRDLLKQAKAVTQLLSKLPDSSVAEPAGADGYMEITFRAKVAITDFDRMEKEAQRWNKIRGLVSSIRGEPLELKIVSAREGSMIVTLIGNLGDLFAVVLGAITIREKILKHKLDRQLIARSVEKETLQVVEADHEAKEKAVLEQEIERLTEELSSGGRQVGSPHPAIRGALDEVQKFYDLGGSVDFVFNGNDAVRRVNELAESVQRSEAIFRQIEKGLQLTDGNDAPVGDDRAEQK